MHMHSHASDLKRLPYASHFELFLIDSFLKFWVNFLPEYAEESEAPHYVTKLLS